MKKTVIISVTIIVCCLQQSVNCYAQGTAINSTGAKADSSAMLDVSSTNKGFAIPRMTTAQRNGISSPMIGLQIFNTECERVNVYTSLGWQPLNPGIGAGAAGSITGSSVVCQGQNNVSYSVSPIQNATNYIWSYSGAGATISGNTNTISVDFSASASSGNLTVYGSNICDSGAVSSNFPVSVHIIPVPAPNESTHTPYGLHIIWKWNKVTGATGYKWNSVNDYGSATNSGTDTSYDQTGLDYNTPYTLYVWSYNSCCNSTAATLTQSTNPFVCGQDNVTFTYRGATQTYGSVIGANSTCWLDRNLGASQKATALNDDDAYGDLFQWGRGDDGHQSRTANTTTVRSSTDQPGHPNYITYWGNPYYDWRDPQNPNLWQGVNGINNPCPSGWRIPTNDELEDERTSWATSDGYGAFGSDLKWVTTCGAKDPGDGSIYGEGVWTSYWSSSTDSFKSGALELELSSAIVYYDMRVMGYCVRCIKD